MEMQGVNKKSTEQKDSDQARQDAVEAEVDRMKKLPTSSTYAIHRLKVLGKMLDLLKIPQKDRTATETDDLERLFAELAF